MTYAQGPERLREESVVTGPSLAPTTVFAPTDGSELITGPPMRDTRVQTSSASRYEPDALITAAVGLVLVVVGLIVIARGGFDGPMALPVVKVLGFTHTTTLGLIEVGIGALLLLAGATRSRSAEVLWGMVLGIAGFVGAVQTKSFVHSLALESSMAWIVTIAGVIVAVSALMLPRFATRSVVVKEVQR